MLILHRSRMGKTSDKGMMVKRGNRKKLMEYYGNGEH